MYEVAIGTSSVPTGHTLAVGGATRAGEIRVGRDNAASISKEIREHIPEHGHLPNIPSAQEVETNGIGLGEMNRLLLEKIEEQMLRILKLEERIKASESSK